jgi:hypothetical protein
VIGALAPLAAAALAALPAGAVRYRAELAGVPVGAAELRVACGPRSCEVTYASRLRLPAEAGGGLSEARVEAEVDPAGRYRGGRLRAGRDGALRDARGIPGAVPAALLEVVAATEPRRGGAPRCFPWFEEGTATEAATACVQDHPGGAELEAGALRAVLVAGADGFPDEVRVEGRFRWVRDAGAAAPARAPTLAGTRVPGPEDPALARRFCGVELEPVAAPPPPGLPPPRAPGESCRERTAAYLAAARAGGLTGRTAVGVAWDGGDYVWHAWPELLVAGAWVPVDPSFGQLPARGPRFAVGRYGPDEPAARDAAGARILACWGAARVEGP